MRSVPTTHNNSKAHRRLLAGGINHLLQVEGPHYVGGTGEPAFVNSWVNFDTNRAAHFYKDPFGLVHLGGIIQTGALNTNAFVLPDGYKPSTLTLGGGFAHFCGATATGMGELRINIDGSVNPFGAPASWLYFSLYGITFIGEE